MGNFCILKPVSLALVSLFCISSGQTAKNTAASPAGISDLAVRDLVTETLIRGLEATEVSPVPPVSPACLQIAGVQGANGTLVVSSRARLLTVPGDVHRDTMRELSVKFGASGLKVAAQLVMLTSNLEWVNHQGVDVLTLGFERGLFNGFFNGAPHFKDVVKVARAGDELCVSAG